MLPYIRHLGARATRMFLTVAVVMVPAMLAVYVAQRLGLIALAGRALAPAMAFLGLPPEAAVIWASTALINLYAGVATVAAFSGDLQLSGAQMSALGAMMLFAHNLPTEQAIVRRAGASALFTGALRLAVGAAYGAAVVWVCRWGGWLQEPVSLAWLTGSAAAGTPGWAQWLLVTARSLLLIWCVICALVVLLDGLEKIGVTRALTRLLAPVLKSTGVEERAAPVTTIGMLLGLAYGGALIIDATARDHYDRRTLLLALCWLSLFHSLIEDTLLVVALGASPWIVLALRGVVTFCVLVALAALTRPHTRWGRRLAA